jgi:predicted amidohydrolase
LAKPVFEARAYDLLVGLVPHLIEKVLAIMQSVDDIVLCITHNPEKAINLKFLMYLFDLMYGLKINYKSEIFLVGGDNEIAD